MSARSWKQYDAIADHHEARKRRSHAERLFTHTARQSADDTAAERRRWAEWIGSGADLRAVHKLEWFVAGRCTDPVTVQRTVRNPKGTYSMLADIEVRCRKCSACLRQRSKEWAARARQEVALAQRTWFVTLTLTAAEQAHAVNVARHHARKSGFDYDAEPEPERFRGLVRVLSPLVTKWLKRVRKQSKSRYRFMLVVEAHTSGLPHFHALLHEVPGRPPITKRCIQEQWGHGFSNAKLVDRENARAAYYVTKYLAKTARVRVRASGGYGKTL